MGPRQRAVAHGRLRARRDRVRGAADQHATPIGSSRIKPPASTPRQMLVTTPANPLASPLGWVTTNTTIGNNVDAYLDRDNNNVARRRQPAGCRRNQRVRLHLERRHRSDRVTNQKVGGDEPVLSEQPSLHDRLYGYGFTESGGQFPDQQLRQAAESATIRSTPRPRTAAASTTRTSRTPPDGDRPRMQMYLWTRPDAEPRRRSGLGHRVPRVRPRPDMADDRQHGGRHRGAIGEGMSDTLANYINSDDRVAEYSTNNANGIRNTLTRTTRAPTAIMVGTRRRTSTARSTRRRCGGCVSCGSRRDGARSPCFDYIVDGMNYTVRAAGVRGHARRDPACPSTNLAAGDRPVSGAVARCGTPSRSSVSALVPTEWRSAVLLCLFARVVRQAGRVPDGPPTNTRPGDHQHPAANGVARPCRSARS